MRTPVVCAGHGVRAGRAWATVGGARFGPGVCGALALAALSVWPAVGAVSSAVQPSLPGAPATSPNPNAQRDAAPEDEPQVWAPALDIAAAVARLGRARAELVPQFGVYTDGPCLLGAVLGNAGAASVRYPFRKGTTYVVMAAAPTDGMDIDLVLTGEDDGEKITEAMADGTPIIAFVPKADGVYEIRLEMWHPRPTAAALVILELGGASIEPARFDQALLACLQRCEVYAAGRERVRPASLPDRFTLFGAVMAPEESVTMQGLPGDLGPIALVSAADGAASDVNVVVADARGREVARDTGPDASAAVAVAELKGAAATGQLEVSMQHAAGTGPALVVTLLLAE